MRFSHLMVVLALCSMAATNAVAQPQGETSASFRVFLRGAAIGGEDITVRRTDAGTTISGNGRLGPPLELVTRQFTVRYDAQWRPIELSIDATAKGAVLNIRTAFSNGVANNEIVQAGAPTKKQDTVAPDTLVLPNLFFASYEALAQRLASVPDGGSFKAYIAPQAEITVKQTARSSQKVETARRVIDVRTYGLTFQNPGAALDAIVWTDETGHLLKFEVPAQQLIFVREDLASVATRALVVTRAGDASVRIPGNGFNLAGTLSQPSGPAPKNGRYPAIILIAGSGPVDRDETVAGIPILGLLAGQLADAGYYVLRYDKRGIGQSGGRAESATIEDYAEDARSAFRFLRDRKDIDKDRIVLLGHSEGALVAMQLASREDDVAAVVLAAAPSVPGGELVLEQQRYLLEQSNLPEAERTSRIDLQKRIQAAVLGEGSWDQIPATLRRQADTTWFRSFLQFSPADAMRRLEQPVLILQGELDRQVPPHHADRLAEFARARDQKLADAVQVTKLDGVNHLLVPATTGGLEEYPKLAGKGLDPRVAKTVVDWLGKTLARLK